MENVTFQVDLDQAKAFLLKIIASSSEEKKLNWLSGQVQKLEENYSERSLFLAFSSASRFFEKHPVALDKSTIAEADKLRAGFKLYSWNLLEIVRVYISLFIPYEDKKNYISTLDKLFETGDVAEVTALYKAIPLWPRPQAHTKRAAEGVRTNMTIVLDAIAVENPFPAEYLDEIAWNQLLLKSIFTERSIFKIIGADQRANQKLANTLFDFAHERWAAGRYVIPELWRFAGKFLQPAQLKDIKKLLKEGNELEQEAAILVCEDSNLPEAADLKAKYPKIAKSVKAKNLDWDQLGKNYLKTLGQLPSGYQQAGSGVSTKHTNL
ncbi:MAG: EboA domain-containing protein [Flammeovirgaceae bacterium]|nr:EboA domain-containing protein [Flammeovirgaceae bacterium]